MKMVYLGCVRCDEKPGVELCNVVELGSYSPFTRFYVETFFHFTANTFAPRSDPGKNVTVEHTGYMVHIYRPSATDDLAFVSITDLEYPREVAHSLLRKMCDEFRTRFPRTAYATMKKDSQPLSYPELNDYLAKYQKPEEADSMAKIKKELDETTIIIKKAVDSLMERGEKLEDLVAKSDGLSAQSKMFYTQAKKQNSCCVVM